MSFIRRLLGLERHANQIVTDWKEYTPAVSGSLVDDEGNAEGSFADTIIYNVWRWRRVGEEMECRWEYQHTDGTGSDDGSERYFMQLPTGYKIDYSKLTGYATSNVGVVVGSGVIGNDSDGGLGHYTTAVYPCVIGTGNLIAVHAPYISAAKVDGQFFDTGFSNGMYDWGTTAQQLSLRWSVPILGWSSKIRG